LAQILEPLVSLKSQPMTDALCWEALPRIVRSLRLVYQNGADRAGREDLCFVSLCGGIALANAGLGAVHGLAAPLGGMFPAPHGALCARLLAPVMRSNIEALSARHPHSTVFPKFLRMASFFCPRKEPSPLAMINWLEETCEWLQIPRLACYGVRTDHFQEIAEKAAVAGSMKGNPVCLSVEELISILSQAL
jgi:alcohol dehydrogenase class IV